MSMKSASSGIIADAFVSACRSLAEIHQLAYEAGQVEIAKKAADAIFRAESMAKLAVSMASAPPLEDDDVQG